MKWVLFSSELSIEVTEGKALSFFLLGYSLQAVQNQSEYIVVALTRRELPYGLTTRSNTTIIYPLSKPPK